MEVGSKKLKSRRRKKKVTSAEISILCLELDFELEILGGAIKNRKVPNQKVSLEMTKECPREPQNLDR